MSHTMAGYDNNRRKVVAIKDGPFTRADRMTFDNMLLQQPRDSDEVWHVRPNGEFVATTRIKC